MREFREFVFYFFVKTQYPCGFAAIDRLLFFGEDAVRRRKNLASLYICKCNEKVD